MEGLEPIREEKIMKGLRDEGYTRKGGGGAESKSKKLYPWPVLSPKGVTGNDDDEADS